MSNNYPTTIIEIEDLLPCEEGGWIGGIRGHFEITGSERGDWSCFDVEAFKRGVWTKIPEGAFREFILAQINGPQSDCVIDAISDAQFEFYPEGEYQGGRDDEHRLTAGELGVGGR